MKKNGNSRSGRVCRRQQHVNIGNMENMSQSGFLIKRAHEGVSVWTFSFSDIFENFYKYLINKCL